MAGWIPLFKIGGTISNENVCINKVTEITIELSKTKDLVFSRIENLDKF